MTDISNILPAATSSVVTQKMQGPESGFSMLLPPFSSVSHAAIQPSPNQMSSSLANSVTSDAAASSIINGNETNVAGTETNHNMWMTNYAKENNVLQHPSTPSTSNYNVSGWHNGGNFGGMSSEPNNDVMWSPFFESRASSAVGSLPSTSSCFSTTAVRSTPVASAAPLHSTSQFSNTSQQDFSSAATGPSPNDGNWITSYYEGGGTTPSYQNSFSSYSQGYQPTSWPTQNSMQGQRNDEMLLAAWSPDNLDLVGGFGSSTDTSMGVITGPIGDVTGPQAPNGMSSSTTFSSLHNSFDMTDEAIDDVIKLCDDKDLLKMIDCTVFKEEDGSFEAEQENNNVEGAQNQLETSPEEPSLTTLVPMAPTSAPPIVAQRTSFLPPQEPPKKMPGTPKPSCPQSSEEAILQQRPITLEKIELEERMVTGKIATKRRRPPLSSSAPPPSMNLTATPRAKKICTAAESGDDDAANIVRVPTVLQLLASQSTEPSGEKTGKRGPGRPPKTDRPIPDKLPRKKKQKNSDDDLEEDVDADGTNETKKKKEKGAKGEEEGEEERKRRERERVLNNIASKKAREKRKQKFLEIFRLQLQLQDANDRKKQEEQDLKLEIAAILKKLGKCRKCLSWYEDFKKMHSITDVSL